MDSAHIFISHTATGRREQFDVVHFDGHGVFDPRVGLGERCFEAPDQDDQLERRKSELIDAARLAAMKPSAVLYNIGRGGTVDQAALLEALESNHLAAAYLDVTDPEPLPPSHPLWTAPNCFITPHTYHFDPRREPSKAFAGLWTYRRIPDRSNFAPGSYASDITLMNVPMLDYLLGDISDAGEEERARHIGQAGELSLSFFYWLQTEAPRPDGGAGWPGLRLRGDVTGTTDGLAKMPYIRESRHIRAEFTIRQQHVAEAARPHQIYAEHFSDSVGIGYYRIDLHPSTGQAGAGDNYIDVGSLPFQIPLGALVPVRMENLLPACKNIGTTHITNGCYRLHPIEWNIGEAAGALAAYCLERKSAPRQVYQSRELLAEFQRRLIAQSVELEWLRNLALADGDPHIHAR